MYHVSLETPPQPTTPDEWQDAVDRANFLLEIEIVRELGLVTLPVGMVIDVDACEELLTAGERQGVTPQRTLPVTEEVAA